MIVGALSPAEIEEYWPHMESRFRSFEERTHGDITAEILKQECLEGKRQCWVAVNEGIEAVALTEVAGLNNRVWVEYCSGEGRQDWQDKIMDAIEAWAREIEAPGVLTFSRTGWTPFLKGRGYRETHRVMEKVF